MHSTLRSLATSEEIFAQVNEPLLNRIEAIKQNDEGEGDFLIISFSHFLPRQANRSQFCLVGVSSFDPL